MDAAGNALVGEIDVFGPPTTLEQAEEMVGVFEVSSAFAHAHVEPDAEIGAGERGFYEAEDASVVPPDRWREDGDFTEDLGILKAQEE